MNSVTTQNLIIFDGVCLFCNGWVAFIARRDRNKRFLFASAQTARGRAEFAAAGLPPDQIETIVLVQEGRRFVESDAVIQILAGLGGVWSLAVGARAIPRILRDWVYRRVARNRYSIAGMATECPLPPADIRDRFLIEKTSTEEKYAD